MKKIFERGCIVFSILPSGHGQLDTGEYVLETCKRWRVLRDDKVVFKFKFKFNFDFFMGFKSLFGKDTRLGSFEFEGEEKIVWCRGIKNPAIIIDGEIVLDGDDYLFPVKDNRSLHLLSLMLLFNTSRYHGD